MASQIQGPSPGAIQNQASGDKVALNELKSYINQTAQETMNALQDLSQEVGGRFKTENPNKSQKEEGLSKNQDAQNAREAKNEDAQVAGLVAEEDVERKKRKKKKFEEKLKALSDVIGFIDVNQLDEDEKKELNEFKQTLKHLNTLNKQLELLENEEAFLEDVIQKSEQQNQQQNQQQDQQQDQDNANDDEQELANTIKDDNNQPENPINRKEL
tara:strand:+ start:813 stop:1454 length:642 start_codon:yes stop_codon:yes gene_type:complete